MDFARHGAFQMYNTYIGGVHLSDQRVVSNVPHVRGIDWYFKVFFCNAHIMP